MEEEKKTFKEKWQDKKYQAKVKLSGYGVFVLIVIIMLAFGNVNTNVDNNEYNNDSSIETNTIMFNKPQVNNYTYKIEIVNEKEGNKELITYNGKISDASEEIIKKIDKKEYKYKIKENKYYVLDNDNYILTSKENVYDVLDYKYLDIDNINNYLSVSNEVNNEYYVYLKDIILDSNIDEYIIISIKDNKLTVDYTNLINYLNNDDYDSYIVNFNYDV